MSPWIIPCTIPWRLLATRHGDGTCPTIPPPGGSGSLSGQGSKHLPSRSQPKTISSGMPFLVIDNSLDSVSPRNLRQPLSRSLTVLKMDIRRNLHTLHRDELMHWNQVLRECGAVYHRNCIYFTPLLSVLFFFFFF